MRPSARLNSATPFADLGFALVRDTKSQQPSLLAIVLNGWPGSATKVTASAPAALQLAPDFAAFVCADRDEQRSTTNNVTPIECFVCDILATGRFMVQVSLE
jgi:hypothetical protein